MIGNGIFTRNHSIISSEEEIQESDSEDDDIGLSWTYSPHFEEQKVEDKRKHLKNFINSRHMRTSTTNSDGGFLDLISRELKQKDAHINFPQNDRNNLKNKSGHWSKQKEELQNEDFGDYLMNKCDSTSNNLLLNGYTSTTKTDNKQKSSTSSIISSSFTFTTDSHIAQFIEGRKRSDLIFESCSSSSLIGLNENFSSNIDKLVEHQSCWDEEEEENQININLPKDEVNLNNLNQNGYSNNIFDLQNNQLVSSSYTNTSSLNTKSRLHSSTNLSQLNSSADSCSTLQEIPITDHIQMVQDPMLLFNEESNLSELAGKIGVNFEVREAEGAFVFSQPSSKRIIIFNPQLYINKEGQPTEGIRISLHKNEKLYREGHLWPVEKWLGMITLEGVCTRFFSSSTFSDI